MKARNLIKKRFKSYVEIISIEDPADQSTGNFKISVEGKLIHSKTDGDGDFNTNQKHQKVFSAIEGELEKQNRGVDDPLLQKLLVQESLEDDDEQTSSNRSVIVSICTLLLSIPALIGA